MHPAFLDNMSWEMAEVYGAITDQILINLARHFPFYDAGDPLPSSAFEYQASMLAQMGQVNAETMRIIRNGLADADEALKNTLEQAIIDSVRKTSPELWEGVKKGVLMPPMVPVLSPNQYRAFQLYYTQAADKLNLVNTVMLESTKSAYEQTITDVVSDIELADRLNRTQIALDAAAGETITGVSSWNQALRHATDKLKNGGITGFVDHAGHHWSAEAYTAMDIRTTTFNTARAAVWEQNQSFGNDLYIVSYHNGARPLCYPWQNKVISANNNAGVTYDLDGNEIAVIAQSDTSYGEAAGLFGINCKHYPTPWIPGVSLADGKPQDKEDNDRAYAESQEQRRLERKLREEKRDLMMAKAQGRPQEEIDRLQAKCRKSSEDIDTFCKETGRARHRDREAVYTKREFPDKERYDVSAFERAQKEQIDQFYQNGGAQQNYTFGQMTPNVTTPHVVPQYDFGGNDATITQEGQTIIKDTIARLQEQYPIPEGYTLDVVDFRTRRGIGYEEDLEDLLDRLEVQDNDHYNGVKAQFVPLGSNSKRLCIEYVDTTLPNYSPKAQVFDEIHQVMMRNPTGKPFNVGWGYECDTIHEYGHLLSHVYGFYGSEDPEFVSWFMSLDKERIKTELSLYAATNWNEFFAESFLQSFSPYQSDLSKQAMEYLRKKMTGQ